MSNNCQRYSSTPCKYDEAIIGSNVLDESNTCHKPNQNKTTR